MKSASFNSVLLRSGFLLALVLASGQVPAARAADPASIASGAPLAIHLPVPEIETLPNGLQLVWFLSDSLPVVDIGVLIKSGYRDDPAGKSGTAELVSSAMDRGSAGMTAQQMAAAVERLGASRYVSADEDTFSLGMHGLAPDADELLDLLAKMTLSPDFAPAEVDREKERILDRWNHLADYGEALAGLAFRRLMTSGTSYARGGFVSVPEFKRVGRADVTAYYKKHFTPHNAVIMVVGRVDKTKFRQKVIDRFGAWSGEAPKHQYVLQSFPKLKPARGQIVVVDRPALTQAQVRIGFRAPSIHAPEHYALSVVNALLGEYFNSRLNALIRDKLSLTYGISSSFAYSVDFADFVITSATRNESVGQLVKKTEDVLKELKREPIPAAEIGTAKDYLIGGFPLGTATLGSVASRWLAGYIFDLSPSYLNEFVPKVSTVTPADAVAAVAKDFKLDDLLIVIAGNAKEITASLKESDFKSIKRVSAGDLM